MKERDTVWDALKECSKTKFDADRQRFLNQAITNDDGSWIKHTAYHWSRNLNGERMDYWPSRKKFQWRGKVMRGLGVMYRIIESATSARKQA